jgi:transcriptional antiterminator RfaH
VSNDASMKWYVAQLKPNGFERALANLRQQNFETFMPMRRKTVRHARQLKAVLRPVFPGYLFIRFGAARSDWRKINSTFGVNKLVSFESEQPAPVPEALMQGLQKRCDARHVLKPLDDLKTGEEVKMISGAFAEFIGEIESFVASDCVRILFDFMGQKTRLDVPRSDVERA